MRVFYFAVLCMTMSMAFDTCPSTWSHNDGKCLWPKQHSYAHHSVAQASDPTAACCALCAGSDGKCVSWLLFKDKKDGFPGNESPLFRCPVRDILFCSQYLHPQQCNRQRQRTEQPDLRKWRGTPATSAANPKAIACTSWCPERSFLCC